MIASIIEVLDLVAAARLSASARHGLCELVPIEGGTAPAKYTGGDSWQVVSVDAGGDWSYWRLTDRIREARDERMASCDTIITATHSLRLVTLISREVCDSAVDTARAAASDMRKASRTVRDATGAMTAEISVSGIDGDSARVYAAEFKGAGGSIPAGKMLVAIDMVVAITGREECFGDCGSPIDATCAVIAGASDAKVIECLGERINEICDNAPCPTECEVIEGMDASEIVACVPSADRPALTVAMIATPEATPEVIVVGIEGANKGDAVRAILCDPCPECDPAEVTFSGIPLVSIPSGDTEDIDCNTAIDAVRVSGADEEQKNGLYIPSATINGRTSYDSAPNHTIEWNGSQYILRDIFVGTDYITTDSPADPWSGTWVVFGTSDPAEATIAQATIATFCTAPCDPLEVTVNGEAYAEVEDPCGSTENVRVLDANDNAIGLLSSGIWRIPSATVQLQDSAGNPIGSADSYLPGANTTKTAPDGSVQRQDSVGANIGTPIAVRSNQTGLAVTCPDGTVTINNSVPTLLHTVAVKSNGSAVQAIADSTITKPDGTTVGLPATVALDVRDYRSGIAYQFGMILHYGNSTSYRTGDEGDMYANGFFDYTRPVYPTHYAELVNNTTLVSNNIHGNTNRFTDRDGNQTYSDDIVQDHFQGVEIYRVLQSAANWNGAIDGAVALSLGGDSDWRLTPARILLTVMNGAAGAGANFLNFAPFSISNTNYWTSTTQAFSTANAFRVASGTAVTIAKTNTYAWLACRRFI